MTKADKHYLHYIHARKAAILNDSANTTAGYWKDIYRLQYAELDMMERVIRENVNGRTGIRISGQNRKA